MARSHFDRIGWYEELSGSFEPCLKGFDIMVNNMPLHDSNTVISTTRLTKTFGKLVAINDLNLEVTRGDVFGFLGPNGSGKTTTLRMLPAFLRPYTCRALLFCSHPSYPLPTNSPT